jgi:hypothetical protein
MRFIRFCMLRSLWDSGSTPSRPGIGQPPAASRTRSDYFSARYEWPEVTGTGGGYAHPRHSARDLLNHPGG